MKQLDIRNLSACAYLFASNFVWHYINPNLPNIAGDYAGLNGLGSFFDALNKEVDEFTVRPIGITVFGDELVVTHVRNSMRYHDEQIEVDAIVVWRIVDGRIAEAWDIPSTHPV